MVVSKPNNLTCTSFSIQALHSSILAKYHTDHGYQSEDTLYNLAREAVGLVGVLQDHAHKVVEEDVGGLRGQLGEGLDHYVEWLQTAGLQVGKHNDVAHAPKCNVAKC